MKTLSLLIAGLILTALPANTQAMVTEIPVVEWIRQLGTSVGDSGFDVSVDSSGNAYVTGRTYGGLDGNIGAGGLDMFLTKYDTTVPVSRICEEDHLQLCFGVECKLPDVRRV
jgi:hypothetical protein